MLRRRIIPCLDVHDGRVVKGVQFINLTDEGDPVELAGVDLLPALDGQTYVLEVNAVPGWRALARTLSVDVGRLVLE